jgi:hypothetical protein
LDQDFWQSLPPEFDATTYQSLYADLAHLTPSELLAHYQEFGAKEGRVANSLRNRDDFATLIPSRATVLEIGPFCNPIVRGPNVAYADTLSQEDLISRAKGIGLDPSGAPRIDHVCPTGELSGIDRRFDVAISSHCLEHQCDLAGHLKEVGSLLTSGGAYFLLVPDKRYCCDHFIPLSSLAEVVVARREGRKKHTLRSVIEHRALTTHNDSVRHWQGDHGILFENLEQRIAAAIGEFDHSEDVDVHAWYFTPDSASGILFALQNIGESPFMIERIYPTRSTANEFWMILRAC